MRILIVAVLLFSNVVFAQECKPKQRSYWAIPVGLLTAGAIGYMINDKDRTTGAWSGIAAILGTGIVLTLSFD